MLQAPEPLVLDLLESLAAGARPYSEVMEAWRTSCPRLPVWEDANDLGLVSRHGNLVVLTKVGQELLNSRR